MSVKIVIGKNFGDEGKGLAIDYFASKCEKADHAAICVRHNGGAQAGHTVDLPDKRFVFSQLSSGSFRAAETYWADHFLPDLYKLSAEQSAFSSLAGRIPQIYASPACRCTYIGDVLLNMLLETARGQNRHGSCGMGINEAVVRSVSFPLYLGDIIGLGASALYSKLKILQKEYLPIRLSELKLDQKNAGEYGEMLHNDTILRNTAEEMARSAETVQLKEQDFLKTYDDILFEGAQGLLLDECYLKYAPHLTSSRTGLFEPARILRSIFGDDTALPKTEIAYITRSYVTRHGAGPLPYEFPCAQSIYAQNDQTNVSNEWQGTLRTAPHGDIADFLEAVPADLNEGNLPADVSLFVTHLNESDGCVVTKNGNIPVRIYCEEAALKTLFGKVYYSMSPFADEICEL